MHKITSLFICCSGFFWLDGFSQPKMVKPDLSVKVNFQTVNRTISLSIDENKSATVHLDARPNSGVAWISNVNFTIGTIEFDVKGKDLPQQSFVGLAFHRVDDSTYDAIYFRPFNFQAADTARKSHGVQYISLPKYDWSVLREKFPNKYEHQLMTRVDPNGWFHASIVVSKESIKVYVNKEEKPSLVVQPITDHLYGKLGFWVGNGSEGSFSNLVVRSE